MHSVLEMRQTRCSSDEKSQNEASHLTLSHYDDKKHTQKDLI